MTKKIDSGRPVGAARGVNATRGVSSVGKTEEVQGAGAVQSVSRAGSVNKVTADNLRITSRNQTQILKIVNEEVDKLFGERGLPHSDREAIKLAVRMAIDAAAVSDEEEHAAGKPAK